MNYEKPVWLTDKEWANYLEQFCVLREMHQSAMEEMRIICATRTCNDLFSQMSLVTLDQADELREMVYG